MGSALKRLYIPALRLGRRCYSLALACVITFALYYNVTRRFTAGQNLVELFFVLTSVVLWLKWFMSNEQIPAFIWANTPELLAAESPWPVLPSAFAALWLGVSLQAQFWQGTVLVTVGSLLCWHAARLRAAPQPTPVKVSCGEGEH